MKKRYFILIITLISLFAFIVVLLETGKIIKACMNVYNELGNGFLEAVYQEALAIEFGLMNIPFRREAKIDIFYKGKKLSKEYFADFICYDTIVVELKAVSKLVNANKAQVLNYLHGTKLAVGLLISPKVEF